MSVTLTPKANPISVIENTPQLFKCLTSICRPKANVTWYLGSEQLTSATVSSPSQDVTTSTLNFTSQRKHQNMTIHRQESNGGQLRTSDKPTINVIYGPSQIVCKLDPPDPPSCRVGSSARSSNIVSAIQGHTITISCSCDSNPPSIYSWSVTGVSTPTSGQSFILLVQKSTTITLTMENSMQFTNGKNEKGRIPPVVKPLKNITVLEKSQVNVACEVTASVPNKTIFRWENISDMTSVATEQTLGIANISRAQGGYYRCNATNFMEPTGYDSTVGNSYNTVYIDMRQK
ncbi:hypothetical protein MAR_020684 [Mya arenaria]|uniref:Ig-like domain-containing protein n=1 Tax=Mya arenaria TaxID=6604 RepID=A0ABY7E5K4_MYAAR|nr:hypothetical protein MAR_020684 [Mya arenaria]